MPVFHTTAPPPAPAEGTLRGADHDRGLQVLQVAVVQTCHATPSVVRVTCQLPAHAPLAPWQRANTAVRIQLGAAFADVSRIYTVRSVDTALGQFVFDVVLHASHGPMLRWVGDLRPGDMFALTGPRPHLQVPLHPSGHALLFADASAVPALFALLRQWPATMRADLWVSSDDAQAVDELPAVEGVHVHRLPAPAQGDPAPLLRIAQACVADRRRSVVWAAGEREEMRELRRHFLQHAGLPREAVAVAGYWKRGETTTETDRRRRLNYQRVLDQGGGLQDVDDLADDI